MCVILALPLRDVCMVFAWHSPLIFAYVFTSVKFFSMCLRVSSNFRLIALPVPLSVRLEADGEAGGFMFDVFSGLFAVSFSVSFDGKRLSRWTLQSDSCELVNPGGGAGGGGAGVEGDGKAGG